MGSTYTRSGIRETALFARWFFVAAQQHPGMQWIRPFRFRKAPRTRPKRPLAAASLAPRLVRGACQHLGDVLQRSDTARKTPAGGVGPAGASEAVPLPDSDPAGHPAQGGTVRLPPAACRKGSAGRRSITGGRQTHSSPQFRFIRVWNPSPLHRLPLRPRTYGLPAAAASVPVHACANPGRRVRCIPKARCIVAFLAQFGPCERKVTGFGECVEIRSRGQSQTPRPLRHQIPSRRALGAGDPRSDGDLR